MADPTRDRDDTTTPEISRLELLLAAITGDTDRIAAHLAQREAGTAWVERAGPSAPALGAWLRRHTFDAFETDEFAQLPDGANPLLAHIYTTSPFAASWYGARARGEQVRAAALSALYTQRAHPGGPFPDPREPGAFSPQAVLATAARQLGIRIWQLPPLRHKDDPAKDSAPPLAWIITYPDDPTVPRMPDIAVRTNSNTHERELFAAAMALGYFHRVRDYITDPLAPRGAHLLPTEPAVTALLHQFAVALLCLPPDCPSDRGCHCNYIRARLNTPPPDHPDSTDQLTNIPVRRAGRQTGNLPPSRADHTNRADHRTNQDNPASSNPR